MTTRLSAGAAPERQAAAARAEAEGTVLGAAASYGAVETKP